MSAYKRDLIEKRNRIVAQSREIITRCEKEGRTPTAEEQAHFDTAMKDQEEVRKLLESIERQEALDAELATTRGTNLGTGSQEPGGGRDSREIPAQQIGEGRYAIDLSAYDENSRERGSIEARSSSAFQQKFGRELRAALQATGSGQSGAYLTTPIQVAQGLLQRLDDRVHIRAAATVIPLPFAMSLGQVTLEQDAEDGDWTSELAVGEEENSIGLGRRDMTPHPIGKWATISNMLMRVATLDPMRLLLDRLAYKFSISEEKCFQLGHGNGQPLGVFFPSANGVPTSRDIVGGTSTLPTFEGLINAKYALKEQYQRNASWLFHRMTVAKIAQIRDDSGATAGTGQFLWQPSTQLGQPDRLLALPIHMSEYTPNTLTSGLYFGMLADWSFYHIVDSLEMQIQRLVELFALKNKTGVIMRKETDGQPVMGEAFVRLKLG